MGETSVHENFESRNCFVYLIALVIFEGALFSQRFFLALGTVHLSYLDSTPYHSNWSYPFYWIFVSLLLSPPFSSRILTFPLHSLTTARLLQCTEKVTKSIPPCRSISAQTLTFLISQGATYDSIESRFRIIKREAAVLREEVESGTRPEAPVRGAGPKRSPSKKKSVTRNPQSDNNRALNRNLLTIKADLQKSPARPLAGVSPKRTGPENERPQRHKQTTMYLRRSLVMSRWIKLGNHSREYDG